MGNTCRQGPTCEEISVSQLKSGDVICVRDPQCLHAGACLSQNLLCWEVNHAAIVIDSSDLDDQAALFERPGLVEKGKIYLMHALQTGMKIWEVNRYLENNNKGGCMYVRQVLTDGVEHPNFRTHVAKTIDDFFAESADKNYEEDLMSLLSAEFDYFEDACTCCISNGDESSIFCSELVAINLQRSGILDKTRPPDEFVPLDFLKSDGKKIEKASMCQHFSLGARKLLMA